ncbi:MAG: divergent PAP2 family protein [Candidatus Omnitrophica bacterium]|nr:divergent PAP2 family protein [Candidatus Omnitrophota bacterium]
MELKLAPPNYLVFLSTVTAWFTAQTVKVIIGVIKEKRFNFKWFVGTGGMPSSHSAAVSGMATAMGLHYGVESPFFALAFLFAIVVIADAQGVRRSSGKQAEILNRILDDIYWKKKIQEDRLKELLGHTPIQIIAGIAIGIGVVFLFYLKYL